MNATVIRYESETGGEQATVAWDSNMAGCFIVLAKPEGRPQIKRKQAQGLRLCGCWQYAMKTVRKTFN